MSRPNWMIILLAKLFKRTKVNFINKNVKSVGIVTRFNDFIWGGDLKALQSVIDGLKLLNYEVTVSRDIKDLELTDFIFLLNAPVDHTNNLKWLLEKKKPYSVICFWEDFDKYWGPSTYLQNELAQIINTIDQSSIHRKIDNFFCNPDYFLNRPKIEFPVRKKLVRPILENACYNLGNSPQEISILKRDFPNAKFEGAFLPPGMSEDWENNAEISYEFLAFTGLKKNEYLLQIGRLEQRKNQIGTLIACKDLDIPQVFIATKNDQKYYHSLFYKLASTISRGKIFLISEEYDDHKNGNLHIIKMPPGRLPISTLKSAYQNCAVYVHPAFYEAPGYTYLEAANLKIPTIASEWSCIGDYFSYNNLDKTLGGMVQYCSPLNFSDIQNKVLKQISFSNKFTGFVPILKRSRMDLALDLATYFEKYRF